MEQMYMIEIFIDKVTVFSYPQEEETTASKKLIVTVKFGPKTEFVIKEGSLSKGEEPEDDEIVECDEGGRPSVTRSIRVGKSYLFPSYPDTVLQILDRFPLEISVWNDDENEKKEFVGIGTMFWDTEFYNMLRNTADACVPSKPLSIKQITPLMDECCCGQVGSISFILRLSALGGSIMTTFQQIPQDPDSFVFATDRSESLFQCKRIDGDDPNFCMVGSLYESTTLEDPDIINAAKKKVQICTQMDSCAVEDGTSIMFTCGADRAKKPAISKVRMGDIKGPCGNANCTLAQKIKTYLRNTNAYKKQAPQSDGSPDQDDTQEHKNKKICGACSCHKDKFHREDCPEKENVQTRSDVTICHGCGGASKSGVTCANMAECDDLAPAAPPYDGCRDIPDDKNCACNPPKEKPLCGAFDCVCRVEVVNKVTRKEHRSYCPSYKHKASCPVTMMNPESDDGEEHKEDDEKEEPLPYGLPPIKLGPCPVIGRPCCVPDGFARMYKPQAQPAMPPSYSEAGKVCCTKEFERIKKFLTEFMKEDVQDDFRCFNALEATTSTRRCCDKEQKSGKLEGKDCCGSHKIKGMPKTA